jgi:hypothetical protein
VGFEAEFAHRLPQLFGRHRGGERVHPLRLAGARSRSASEKRGGRKVRAFAGNSAGRALSCPLERRLRIADAVGAG